MTKRVEALLREPQRKDLALGCVVFDDQHAPGLLDDE